MLLASACDFVPVDRCEGGSGYCEVEGLRIVSPTAGQVGPSVALEVAATVAAAAPEKVEVEVSRGGAPTKITLSSQGNGRFSGTWTPDQPGAVSLKAISADGEMTSATVQVIADLEPPVFNVSAPAPQRTTGASFSDADGTAWKRDERVIVTVQSSASDVAAGTVQYRLQAIIDGQLGPFTQLRPVQGSSTGGAYSGSVEVDLSEPIFDGFRGSISVQVVGDDRVGNRGLGSTSIPVSRLKWQRTLPVAGTQVDPVITPDGALWTAMQSGSSGVVYRLAVDGGVTSYATAGAPSALLLATLPGTPDAGVYYAASRDAGMGSLDAGYLQVIDPSSGATEQVCGPLSGRVMKQMALLYGQGDSAGSHRTVVFGSHQTGGTLHAKPIRDVTIECRERPLVEPADPDATWAASNGLLYFGQADAVSVLSLGPSSWDLVPGFSGVRFGTVIPTDGGIWGAGAAGNDGGVFALRRSDGRALQEILTEGAMAAALVLAADGRLYFGDGAGNLVMADSSGLLDRVDLDVRVSPLLSEDGRVYAATPTGDIASFDSNLNVLWDIAGLAPGARPALLDCGRDLFGQPVAGKPNVLFVPSGNRVTAIVTDDRRGLAKAPWPRHAHDNGNTASLNTPITLCP